MREALFIDLQGTLGGEGIDDICNFEYYPYSLEALKLANNENILVFIITNQGNIEKGYFTYEDYKRYEERLITIANDAGVIIDGFYCCPHRTTKCDCMKPLPGMIEQAKANFCIDIPNSYVIGDMGCSDMLLAANIGSKSILVRTGVGQGSLNEFRHTWANVEPTFLADNILDAIKLAISNRQ